MVLGYAPSIFHLFCKGNALDVIQKETGRGLFLVQAFSVTI
jgi:hypothetical protein